MLQVTTHFSKNTPFFCLQGEISTIEHFSLKKTLIVFYFMQKKLCRITVVRLNRGLKRFKLALMSMQNAMIIHNDN